MTPVAAGKREATKAQNRRAILDAATEVFAEIGYGAASIRDVIRRTGLASGTFYNYFPDKQSVFRAVLDEHTTELRRRLREARARAGDAETIVREGFQTYFSFIVEDRPLFEMLRRNAGTVRELFDTPALELGILELREDLAALAELSALDLDALASAMGGVAFELGIRLSEQDPPDVERAARFASELFLGGIARLSAGR
ncbi:MAG: TetR/AcrR family transcriptional regulator [Actinobacteria bacterium]|nr:TetR/AcrR family transcriptional regulator [Actinomycetota bacterium]